MAKMGRHRQWRNIAKKLRRKRIRTAKAIERDALAKAEEEQRRLSPGYESRMALELAIQEEMEEAERKEQEMKQLRWEEEEARVREESELRQKLLLEMNEKKEKDRLELEEKIKNKEKEEKEKQEMLSIWIKRFIEGDEERLPEDMYKPYETQPGKEECPFFQKVAACRFRDTCSRNHVRPGVSEILLFPGFYSHFSIQGGQGEYDTDLSLEYEYKETYSHFLEFYRDIREEFETFGRLCRILVCSNLEIHLRGNVYVEYSSEREAMGAFLKMNGRFYAGKQLNCQFVTIPDWKKAVCGLYYKKTCPKGNSCNFLHVFKDPGPPFYQHPRDRMTSDSSSHWRWSESPEPDENEIKRKRKGKNRRDRSKERQRKRTDRTKRSRSREKNCVEGNNNISKKRRHERFRRSKSPKVGINDKRSRSKERSEYMESRRKSPKERRSKDFAEDPSSKSRDRRSPKAK